MLAHALALAVPLQVSFPQCGGRLLVWLGARGDFPPLWEPMGVSRRHNLFLTWTF